MTGCWCSRQRLPTGRHSTPCPFLLPGRTVHPAQGGRRGTSDEVVVVSNADRSTDGTTAGRTRAWSSLEPSTPTITRTGARAVAHFRRGGRRPDRPAGGPEPGRPGPLPGGPRAGVLEPPQLGLGPVVRRGRSRGGHPAAGRGRAAEDRGAATLLGRDGHPRPAAGGARPHGGQLAIPGAVARAVRRARQRPGEGRRVPGPPAAGRPPRPKPLRRGPAHARGAEGPRGAGGARDRLVGRPRSDDRSGERCGVEEGPRPSPDPQRARARACRVRHPPPGARARDGKAERRPRAQPPEPAARRRVPLLRHRRRRAGRPARAPDHDRVAQAALRLVVERDSRAADARRGQRPLRVPTSQGRRLRLCGRHLEADPAAARPALLAHRGVDRQRDDRLRRHELCGHDLRRRQPLRPGDRHLGAPAGDRVSRSAPVPRGGLDRHGDGGLGRARPTPAAAATTRSPTRGRRPPSPTPRSRA